MRKMNIRFFTIADYEEEESWLRRQHQQWLRLVNTCIPCFYYFEECTPEDVVYRLDYQNDQENGDYLQLFRDYGWDCCSEMAGWLYFRKPASEVVAENDGEIFSDGASRVEMIQRIYRTRMLPLLIILLCCILPNWVRLMTRSYGTLDVVLGGVFTVLLLLYLYLIVRCGWKLGKLKQKYERT